VTLFIIRHGEKAFSSEINPLLRHPDPGLTPAGREQARSLVGFFEDIRVDRIYASEYLRAQQTAEPLASERKLPVAIDRRLNEIDNGAVQGMPDGERKLRYPDFWKDYWGHEKDFRFPDGESGEEVKARQSELLGDLASEGGTCVLFSHGGFIRLLLCNIMGMPVYHRYKFTCDFCGITEAFHEGGEWKIMRFGQVTYPLRSRAG
jgi:broad specificity phosphatase PhoE